MQEIMPREESTGIAQDRKHSRVAMQGSHTTRATASSSEKNPDTDQEMDANRYAKIVTGTKAPLWHFLKAALKEDTLLLLPRILLRTMRTLRSVPHTLFIKSESMLARYAFHVIAEWSRAIIKITQIKLEIRTVQKLSPSGPYLFVSNHRSPSDIPILFAAIPVPAAFVANGLFKKIPVFSYWMRASGSVFIELGNPKSALAAFRSMSRRLREGRSLILFPEGHMHQGSGIDEFNRGGIYAAILEGVPIIPICLYGTDKVMRPGSYHINPRKKVIISFGKAIDPKVLERKEKKNIDAIVHQVILDMRTSLENENTRNHS